MKSSVEAVPHKWGKAFTGVLRACYKQGKTDKVKGNEMKKELLNSVGLSYGELSLKGKNRGQFEKLLKNRINKALKEIEYKLTEDLSKLYITGENKDIETIVEKMKKVFEVVGLNPSVKIDRDDDIIKETVLML